MARGFFMGMAKGIAKVLDDKGKIMEIPASRIPKGLTAGQDFDYRASSSGNFRIAAPVSKRSTVSNSAKDRQQYTMQRLMTKGWTGPQAAGIVGRFMVEAFPDLRTTAVGDREIPGGSFGIGQWNRERKAALESYATGKVRPGKFSDNPLVMAAAKAGGNGDAGGLDTQIDFFDWEIRNSPSERLAYAAVRRARTAEESATGMMHYERPRGYLSKSPSSGMHYAKTVRNASAVMKGYDPNYEPKLEFAASQRDLDMANMSVRDETGDLRVMEQSQGDYGRTLGEEGIVSEEASDEDTLGSSLMEEEGGEAMDPGTVDTSPIRAKIQDMIQQGRQVAASGPMLKDIFGR